MKDRVIEEIKAVATEAGSMIVQSRKTGIQITEKSSFKDLVTQVDVEVQEFIIKKLSASFPGAVFIAEERQAKELASAEHMFIIDPIDGTSNFVSGLPFCAVCIGYYRNGQPAAGVVYNPFLEELFEAETGGGAYLNGQRISVSEEPLEHSLVVFGTSPYNPEATDETFARVKRIYGKCLDIRRLGSAAIDICLVASGRVGLYFEARLSIWDYAAAKIILEEAGGRVVRLDGRDIPFTLEKTSVLAGSARMIETFLSL